MIYHHIVCNIQDLGPYPIKQTAIERSGKMHAQVTGVRLIGTKTWYSITDFSHGKGCLKRTQEAMKNGYVEIRAIDGQHVDIDVDRLMAGDANYGK